MDDGYSGGGGRGYRGGGGGGYRGGRGGGGFGGGGGRGGGGYNNQQYNNNGGWDNSGGGGGGRGRGGGGGYYNQQQQQHNGNYYQGGGGGRGGQDGGGRWQDGGGRGGWSGNRGRGRNFTGRGGGRRRPQDSDAQATLPPGLQQINDMPAHTQPVTCMFYDAASSSLYTGGKDGKIKQWRTDSGTMVHEVDLGGEVDSLLYVAAGTAPGQGFLFVGHMPGFFKNAPQQQGQGRGRELRAHDFDGCVKVYNTATGKEQLLTGHRGHINQLIAANSFLFSCGSDASIRVWGMDGELFTCKAIWNAGNGGHSAPVSCLELINGFLMSGDSQGVLKVWDLASGTCTQTIAKAHDSYITRILQYNNLVLSSSSDGTIKAWPIADAPAPGAVLAPQSSFSPLGADEEDLRSRGQRLPNAVVTMEGTCDASGNSVLLVSKRDDPNVSVYTIEESLNYQGCLLQTPFCRTIAHIPGLAIITGDGNGRVRIFTWTQPAMS